MHKMRRNKEGQIGLIKMNLVRIIIVTQRDIKVKFGT